MKKLILYIGLLLCTYEATVTDLKDSPIIPDISVDADEANLRRNGALMLLDDKPFSGHLVSYHSNGQLESENTYFEGLREGKSSQFYSDGSFKEERWYNENQKTGTHYGWWPNGNMKFEFHFVDGLHHGEAKEWQIDGQPYKFFTYTMGQEDGSQKMWESDGSIRANYVVKDGHRYGLIGLKNCKSVDNETGTFSAIPY
tara:strand:+ start:1655 stop:2251 length:597 start_codon:yes stop_codon:yes gene_type:complete